MTIPRSHTERGIFYFSIGPKSSVAHTPFHFALHRSTAPTLHLVFFYVRRFKLNTIFLYKI